jgi:plastocyanin
MKARRLVAAVAVVFVSAAVGTAVRAKDDDKKDNLQAAAVQDATVQFAQPQPQAGGAPTHFLLPDEVTIHKGGTVTFIPNGAAHGIAIHQVSKNTTRADIAEDLCDGNNNETGPANVAADRIARAAVCNGAVVTTVTINGVPTTITGTQNLDYQITDGKGNLIIEPGFNIAASNPRLDDPDHSFRLLATSGASPGDTANPAAIGGNRAGAFLTGTTNPVTPGNRIQVQFMKTGRYLVICMNRAHSLNDHMFGFVNVVDAGEDQQ